MRWSRILLLHLLVYVCALAQSTGSITGQVTDQTEAAMPGVRITITAVDTGSKYATVTNDHGYYTVPSLPPKTYTVTGEADGFKKTVSGQLKLDTGSTGRIDLVMIPAETRQTIEVVADVPAIESQISMVTNTVSEKELESLPLQGRNALELAITIPGVGGDVGSDEGGIFQDVPTAGAGLSISGGRAGSSAILSDGANATSLGIGRATVTFSPDTVQEVQVITSTFSARYGVSGGGIIQTVTRAGTDRFRGTAYWYHRNPALHARQFNRPIPPQQRRHELGLTASGPLTLPKLYSGKGRTWYFVGAEPKRFFDAIDIYERFPTLEERNGDFRNSYVAPGQTRPLIYQQVRCVPTPWDCQQFVPQHRPSSTAQYPLFSANDPDPSKRGYVIPRQMFDPLALKILEEVPLPNMPFDAQGRNYFGTRGVDGHSNRVTVKVDHNLSSKNRLSLNYRDVPTLSDRFRVNRQDLFFTYPSDRSVTRQALLSDSYTISARMVNEFRASYTFSDFGRLPPGDLAHRNYVKEKFDLPNQTNWGYPQFSSGFGTYGFSGSALLGNYIEHQYQTSNDLTMTVGRHTISIGGDFRYGQLNVKSTGVREFCCGIYSFSANQSYAGNANTPGGNGGWAFAGFLMGVPNSVSLRGVVIPYYYRWKVAAGYFQDDFKVRRNLTLNLGVRWQFNSPRAEKYNRQASVNLDNKIELRGPEGDLRGFTFNYEFSGMDGRSIYLEPPHKQNIEPRFGFAWQPNIGWFRKRYGVIRGGYGISHPPVTSRGRDPMPDFGAGSSGAWGFLRWQNNNPPAKTQGRNPDYVISVGRNQPVVQVNPSVLEIPADGLLCNNCGQVRDPRLPAGALIMFTKDAQSPYVQTWNLTTQMQLPARFVLTLSYLGQKGTKLYSPLLGVNHPDRIQYEQLLNEGGDPNELIEDPFGRVDTAGNLLLRPRVDYMRPFPEAGDISIAGITNSNSIFHAGTASVERRFTGSFGLRWNYTFGKSIDTTSDAQLTGGNMYPWGNTRVQNAHDYRANRSVSTFDTRHRVNVTMNWDLPFGYRRRYLNESPKYVQLLVSNWSLNAIGSIFSGFPFTPILNDANGIPGGASGNERIRPDMVPGVPIVNPRWSKRVANDVPYFNPEAFARPEFGNMGDAPRTLDYARQPWKQTLNASLFRDFHPFENRRRYLQFRGEFYNVLNHAVFNLSLPGSESINMFSSAPPVCRTCLSLAGPMPYLVGMGRNDFPIGTRENLLAASYNQNFGKLWRDRNGPGRVVQIGLRLYF